MNWIASEKHFVAIEIEIEVEVGSEIVDSLSTKTILTGFSGLSILIVSLQ